MLFFFNCLNSQLTITFLNGCWKYKVNKVIEPITSIPGILVIKCGLCEMNLSADDFTLKLPTQIQPVFRAEQSSFCSYTDYMCFPKHPGDTDKGAKIDAQADPSLTCFLLPRERWFSMILN